MGLKPGGFVFVWDLLNIFDCTPRDLFKEMSCSSKLSNGSTNKEHPLITSPQNKNYFVDPMKRNM